MNDTEITTARPGSARPRVRVWDPLIRLFHWSLVGLFAFAFLTADEWDNAHETAGYIIGALIMFRILWGFFGSRHARFSDFIYSPSVILGFLKDSLTLKARRYIGHNPAGGLMVLLLLASITGICITGHMMTTDTWWGVDWVEELHEAFAFGALGLIGLHLAGVVLASYEHGENLVRSMFTGTKRQLED